VHAASSENDLVGAGKSLLYFSTAACRCRPEVGFDFRDVADFLVHKAPVFGKPNPILQRDEVALAPVQNLSQFDGQEATGRRAAMNGVGAG